MFKIFALLFLITSISLAYKVSDFQENILKPSPPSGFHTVDTGDQTIGEILAFGDLNGDQYNDYIATPERNQKILSLYFWDSINYAFIRDELEVSTEDFKQMAEVMLSDLTEDGQQQIIITFKKNDDKFKTVIYQVKGCTDYKCTKTEFVLKEDFLSDMTNVPFLISLKSETSPSLFIFQGDHRYILEQDPANSDTFYRKSFEKLLKETHSQKFNIVDKHYASNIDFSGDCHSDLVILSQNSRNKSVLEFYQKQINGGLSLAKELEFTLPIQFMTFIDIDSSGTIDIAFLLKNQSINHFYVLFNNVQSIDEECQQTQEFPFSLEKLELASIQAEFSDESKLIFGDLDSDSYPDLLTIITNKDFRKAQLYKNQEGKNHKRQFMPSEQLNANLISDLKNPVQAIFFDFAENGILDIIITAEEKKQSDGEMTTTRNCIMNNVKDDTLFIKILPLSQSSVYSLSSNKLSSAFGITIQWKITALDGNKQIKLFNQKSQWNYGTLQLPFVCGGLGRTNNYVEDLTVGYDGVGQKMEWSPVIPNSKLLIYKQNGVWSLQTLLTNSERVNQVVYVSVGILIVLGIVIIVLSHREKAEDRKDQYNFIQLIR